MTKTIRDVFDDYLEFVVFDNKLLKAITKYRLSYLNNNPDTLEFFGGNLLGTVPLRFTDKQVNRFYNDVLDIDREPLISSIKEIDSINQDYKVSSDDFNLTIMYVIHRFLTTRALNKTKQETGASEAGTIFFYRTLAALTASNFKFNAKPEIVQAAYSNMSNKFLIKKLGSWNKVIDDRVNALIGKDSKHVKYLQAFKPDDRILYAITDAQGSIKTLFYNYYGEIVKAYEADEAIKSQSSTMKDVEGKEVIKDKTMTLDGLIDTALGDLSRPDTYLNIKLLRIILDISNNVVEDDLRTIIVNLSINFNKNDKLTEEFVKNVIIFSFNYLTAQRSDVRLTDLPAVLITLKNSFSSSRNQDEFFLKTKALGDKIIKRNKLKRLNKSSLTGLRTSLMLYIVLKILTEKTK